MNIGFQLMFQNKFINNIPILRRHVVEMNIVAKEVTYIILHAEVTPFYIQIKFLPPPTHLNLSKYKYYF